MYVNQRWCNNITVHGQVCTLNLEMLTLSVRPHHLKREFPTLVISCVYIHPSANVTTAAELVASTVTNMQGKYPDAPVLVMGDLNSCRLDSSLPSFQQYVDIPTRRKNTLDLCYGNIINAYTSRAYPPLGFADQNVITLLLL